MDLFSWWTPPSYFRYALEYLHFDVGLPWWSTIMAATCALRLLMIWVPIRAQKYAGKVAPHMEQFKEFDKRLQEARIDRNMALGQQLILERSDYCKKHGVSPSSQLLTLFVNGFVFSTQFFAIEKMAKANFPGMSSGGALWFENLVAADPYYILPAVSAVTLWATIKVGILAIQT
ncbi:60Kd inner membrane protein [Aphelenchoides avenae]|nr:60Kd inner membrane protein [Aphelenchus avenae]